MNHKEYFDAFEKEHRRMPSFEEFCRDCPPESTYMYKQLHNEEGKSGWFTRLFLKLFYKE